MGSDHAGVIILGSMRQNLISQSGGKTSHSSSLHFKIISNKSCWSFTETFPIKGKKYTSTVKIFKQRFTPRLTSFSHLPKEPHDTKTKYLLNNKSYTRLSLIFQQSGVPLTSQ